MTREPKKFDDFKEYSQLLLESRIFSEYLETVATLAAARNLEFMSGKEVSDFPLGNVEPESYVERWIKNNVRGGTEEWKDGVGGYFLKLFANYSKAISEGENNE